MSDQLTPAFLDAELGPKCDGCGWRQRPGEPERHRPAGLWLTACPVGGA